MLRTCVLRVYRSRCSLAISAWTGFVGRYRSTLNSLGLSSSVSGYGRWLLAVGDEPCTTSIGDRGPGHGAIGQQRRMPFSHLRDRTRAGEIHAQEGFGCPRMHLDVAPLSGSSSPPSDTLVFVPGSLSPTSARVTLSGGAPLTSTCRWSG